MAEAIAAFSLAANVVQFIDFGSRVTSNFWSFYKAASNTDDSLPDVEIINYDLQNILKELQSSPTSASKTGLAQLAQECQKAATQLEKILQPLITAKKRHEENEKRRKENEGRRNEIDGRQEEQDKESCKERGKEFWKIEKSTGKRASLTAAFKLAWKEDEIQSLKTKVDEFRSQLILHILTSLRELTHENISYQNKILEAVNFISHNEQNARSIDNGFAFPFLEYMTSKLDETRRRNATLQLQRDIRAVIYDSSPQSIITSLSPSMNASRQAILGKQILDSLYYAGMEDREGRITKTYGSTFQWIFKDSPDDERKWTNFKDWLQSDSQLYWITGKPGSGKSTLMKFICERSVRNSNSSAESQPRCVEFLQSWAQGEPLVIASFYFWNSSIAQQKKQSGLFRTLLHQLLGQESQLIPLVTPRTWETLHLFNKDALDWSEKDLSQILSETVSQLTKSSRLCLFIDGLDEFDGDHVVLVDIFKNMITNSRIKLCVASRPWVEFEDAFKHGASLMLQHLTYPDIKEYVSSHMEKNEGFLLLSQREPDYARELEENIIAKSSGVFLWIRLVVASILGGMAYGDRISDLKKRLDMLPSELEELYDRMISSLDPFYLEHAAQLFKFIQVSLSPPELLTLACADEDDSFSSALDRDTKPFSADQIRVLHESMRRRINSRCKGLLKVSSVRGSGDDDRNTPDWEMFTVQYLHRTVKDYMQSNEIQEKFQSTMKSPYDPHLKHCIGILSVIKGMSIEKRSTHSLTLFQSQTRTFLQYAKGVKQQSQSNLMYLMEEFDITCTAISRNFSYYTLRSNNIPWTCIKPLDDPEGPFNCHLLSLATRCSILQYVMGSTLEQGCTVPMEGIAQRDRYHCLYDNSRYPLLFDAVTVLISWHWLPVDVPNMEIIMFLLDHGADPNMLVGSNFEKPFTVWHAALAMLPQPSKNIKQRLLERSRSESSVWRKWLKVYKTMLDYGAGSFTEAARLTAQKRIDTILSKRSFLYRHWETITKELLERQQLPQIYSETPLSF